MDIIILLQYQKNKIQKIYIYKSFISHFYVFSTPVVMTRFSTSYLRTNLNFISSIKSLKIQLNSTQVAHNVIQYFSFEYAKIIIIIII